MDDDRQTAALVPFVPAESGALVLSRAPEIVIEEGRKAAAALTDVLSKKPKKVIMNDEQYLEFEDWQTLGRFYGVTARAEDPEVVEMGDVRGFRCKAVALDATGREISAATAFCLNDEEKWRARPKYEYHIVLSDGRVLSEDEAQQFRPLWIWEASPTASKPDRRLPKKQRTLVGQEPVPFFQLASMAQTRACAKVLRNVLAWVVVLAGYKPTPAEELPHAEEKPNGNGTPAAAAPPPPAEPTRASDAPKDFSASDAARTSGSAPAAAAAPAEPQDTRLRCKCGEVARYYKGISKKTKKEFEGYFCPKPQNDSTRCDYAEFI